MTQFFGNRATEVDVITEKFPKIADLKGRYDFERGARWAAEESLAWVIATETGWISQVYGHRWWLTVAVGVAAFFLVARFFGRREEAAEDAYHRAAGLGKYASQAE